MDWPGNISNSTVTSQSVETHVINLSQTALEQRLLELGQRLHHRVILGHNGLQSRSNHAQLLRVGVAQEFSGGCGELDVEWLSREVVNLSQ